MLFFKVCKCSEITAAELSETEQLLSAQQRKYLNKISENKRFQSLSVRALLMKMLEANFSDISLSYLNANDSGKPYLSGRNDIFISLTHSYDYVGCAVSDRPVGIDIEKIRDVSDATVHRVCTAEEIKYLNEHNPSAFFTLWTLKEAYIKAVGGGLSKISSSSFVKDNEISAFPNKFIIDKTDGYIWSVIQIV